MSTNRALPRQEWRDLSRAERAVMGEALLLRFLVQHGLVANALLKAADIERRGAGSRLSLLDWIVRRGHVSENALTLAMAHCLRLGPPDAPFARTGPGTAVPDPSAPFAKLGLQPRRRRISLRLIRGRLRGP
jgi:hypothetical protein